MPSRLFAGNIRVFSSFLGIIALTKGFAFTSTRNVIGLRLVSIVRQYSIVDTMAITRKRSRNSQVPMVVSSAEDPPGENGESGPSKKKGVSTSLPPIPVTPSPKKSRTRKSRSPDPRIVPVSLKKAKAAKEEKVEGGTSFLTREAVAAINPTQPFLDLNISPTELRPSATLTNGQSFVWRVVEDASSLHFDHDNHDASAEQNKKASQQQSAWGSFDATEWVGILRWRSDQSVVVVVRETPTTTLFRPLTKTNCDELRQFLKEYFQLEHSLDDLYHEWALSDSRLATIAQHIPGVRILDQDPWECLVSFICSSNNNIPRITKMVSAIRREYGQLLLQIDEESFYSFPSVDEMAEKATDQDLREKCGLGYRSKYILETLKLLKEKGGESYLQDLRRESDPEQVQTKLCEFCGVGRKVADCVALFSLKQDDAIPVDVHVWNIARRDYDPDSVLAEMKSLTPTNYRKVGDLFRDRFPTKAGWAHSLLFVAELPSFRPVLPEHLVKEMDDFRKEEQLRKKLAKEAKKPKP